MREGEAEPMRAALEIASAERDRIERELAPERLQRQVDHLMKRPIERDSLGR